MTRSVFPVPTMTSPRKLLLFLALLLVQGAAGAADVAPMLAGSWVPSDPHQIDFASLPKIPSEHNVISDVRSKGKDGGVNQHNYLAHHDGRFWAMWSDGPGIEDRVGQRVKYATSSDGLHWSEPAFLTPEPPGSGPGSPRYGTRSKDGWRWISRGFWKRNGELLALCALDEAAGFFGPGLELRAFRWTGAGGSWEDAGLVAKDAINNFPPGELPTGDWLMSRRTHDYKSKGVQFLIGGKKSLDDWESRPVLGTSSELSAEEPLWWPLPDDRLVALFRDNRGSKYLYRSFSADGGSTWSTPARTNFPDATSKLHGFRLSDGRYILVSNSNPKKRDPLTLALSEDGLSFDRLFYLTGGRHVDYPHAIEQDGHLFIAFSGGKQSVEILKVKIADLDRLEMSRTVATDAAVELAWQVAWKRFHLPEVQTFGDYLSSYEPGREQNHLPSAEEVGRQFPNPCGYSTGMEDGAILGGAMLSMLCDRFAVTRDDALRTKASAVFAGLNRCATVHGVPGFVARNVCPEDGRSVYINSSRDQVTHFVHGLWQYYHSPLSDEADKETIRKLLSAVAQRMIEFVTPGNDYDFCRADGTRCPLGICRMWEVQSHEAARLPMIYAAAWDVTGDERFRAQWRRYSADAIEQSRNPGENKPAYALLQMQCSLEVLHALEPDPQLKKEVRERMELVASLASSRFEKVRAAIGQKSHEEMSMLGPDWRTVPEWKDQKGYPNPQWGPFREIWHLTREAGESALVVLMSDPGTGSAELRTGLAELVRGFDYEHNASCGILYHLAAYWKARRTGQFP